jgi:anti-anti-sigma factor
MGDNENIFRRENALGDFQGDDREPQLKLSRAFAGNRCKLSLTGELKHGNAEFLFTSVQELFDSGCTELVLDLSHVSYCDTAGLQSFVQIYKYIQGKPDLLFNIFVPEGIVMDTLRTCRFDKFLHITQDEAEISGEWKAS